MGVVNATPDSFSDGGAYDPAEHAFALAAAGADWLDIGGESTRPRAEPIPAAVELDRDHPVVAAVHARVALPISIDTRRPAVAREAMAAGASMWNDVFALRGPRAPEVCAELGCDVVLMHMRGEPATMQDDPQYGDVIGEIEDFLEERARTAISAGVRRNRIWVDPGVGFGKTLDHNLALVAGLDRFAALGFPLVFGASRKGMIRRIDPAAIDPGDRLGGSLALALAARRAGAAMVRVHDVAETVQAFAVADAVEAARA